MHEAKTNLRAALWPKAFAARSPAQRGVPAFGSPRLCGEKKSFKEGREGRKSRTIKYYTVFNTSFSIPADCVLIAAALPATSGPL